MIARYGGDEFVIVTPDADPGKLKNRLIQATTGSYKLAGYSFIYSGPSIGMTRTSEGELEPVSVLARADEAMYEIKKKRKARTN